MSKAKEENKLTVPIKNFEQGIIQKISASSSRTLPLVILDENKPFSQYSII